MTTFTHFTHDLSTFRTHTVKNRLSAPTKREGVRCHVRLARLGPASRQLLTGLAILAGEGRVRLTQEIVPAPPLRVDGLSYLRDKESWKVELIIDNRVLVHIDLHEGTEIDAAGYDACDFYFKRCIDPLATPFARFPKLRHYALVYNVSQAGLDRFEAQRLLKMPVDTVAKVSMMLGFLVDSTKARLNLGSRFDWKNLAGPPTPLQEPRALFLTRLIDPGHHPMVEAAQIAELEGMNEMRAGCIRLLRKQFGERFLGGVARSSFALRHFGDVVVEDDKLTQRRNYVQLVRSHPICVTSAGWRGAIGLKLTEYVALSRSFVAQQVPRSWPEGFSAPDNFLAYRSAEQCVESVGRLMADTDLRRSQMYANWRFFNAWMRPDVFAGRIIATALGAVAEV